MPPQAEGSNASTARIGKERRERNREAQQQFRKRKQINDDARLQRLKRLEGVIEKMSTVMVDFTDRLLREDVIQQHPGLITSVQGVITDILALANEAGDPEDGPGTRRTRGITHQGEDGAPAVSEVRLSGPSSDPAVTLDSAMPALVQQEDVFDHSPFKDIFSTQNPSVEHSVGSLDVAAPLLYSRASHLLSAIPQTLGPILWNTSKPLPPNSFSYRLTYSCFSLGNLVLSKSVQSPIPLSEENRMFGSTLRYRQRDEMILRMRWLLGPGTYELRQLAELPWGGRWWDQEFSGSDLASYATATTSIDSSAPQFLSVIGVEKQLVALGRFVKSLHTFHDQSLIHSQSG
ncbi:hypothetical protein NM208_g1772 [Fusarium decemcellulare]|uniref:Uncharacterized protein n=1 Tax=Fusarium decemcellulare TaxID=57161 RepID=A0ACC1SV07_9HYPO|nr:hypothetical protein NM208_g1772 [Fusarium decemcellulare]